MINLNLPAGRNKVEINPLFPFFAAAAILAGQGKYYFFLLCSMFLHEAGHLLAGRLYGLGYCTVRVLPFGFSMSFSRMPDRIFQTIYLSAAGPAMNLAASGVLLSIRIICGCSCANGFIAANIYLALFNLIPILPLDGGRILLEAAACRTAVFYAGTGVKRFSIILSLVIAVSGFFIHIPGIAAANIVFSGFLLLSLTLFSSADELAYTGMRALLKRLSVLSDNSVLAIKHLAAGRNVKLYEVFKRMDAGSFYIVRIMGPGMKPGPEYTDRELLNAAVLHGASITLGEFDDINTHKQG